MRHVYENPHEAAAKGAAARKRMLSQYSPDVVGRLVAGEVKRIKDSIRYDTGGCRRSGHGRVRVLLPPISYIKCGSAEDMHCLSEL